MKFTFTNYHNSVIGYDEYCDKINKIVQWFKDNKINEEEYFFDYPKQYWQLLPKHVPMAVEILDDNVALLFKLNFSDCLYSCL